MSVGFPASVKLHQWAHLAQKVYGGKFYHVGSSVFNKGTRDVDVVCMLEDDVFIEMFGSVHVGELDYKWAGLCLAFSLWAKDHTGLNIDFKFQAISDANERHKGPRSYIGGEITVERRRKSEQNEAQYQQALAEQSSSGQSEKPLAEG